jgi:hypothetical protein
MFRVNIRFFHISIDEITSKKMLLELLCSIEPVDGKRVERNI